MSTQLNLNDPVWVKLTEKGQTHLEVYYSDLRSRVRPGARSYIRTPVPDADGLYQWQLWGLMQIFGEACGVGLAFAFEGGWIFGSRDAALLKLSPQRQGEEPGEA